MQLLHALLAPELPLPSAQVREPRALLARKLRELRAKLARRLLPRRRQVRRRGRRADSFIGAMMQRCAPGAAPPAVARRRPPPRDLPVVCRARVAQQARTPHRRSYFITSAQARAADSPNLTIMR